MKMVYIVKEQFEKDGEEFINTVYGTSSAAFEAAHHLYARNIVDNSQYSVHVSSYPLNF